MSVKLDTSHKDTSPLKADAPLNIAFMVVTRLVYKKSPLKAVACRDIPPIFLTDDTSQDDKSRLRLEDLNIFHISVTDDTSHDERSPLKEEE
jgi:hypothetical protein